MKQPKYTVESLKRLIADNGIVTKAEFRAKFPAATLWAGRRKILNDLGLEESKKANGHWTLESTREIAKNYVYRSQFQEHDKGAYLAAMRSGWLKEICTHMTDKPFIPTGGRKGVPADNRRDLTGQIFGKWTVVSIAPTPQGYRDLFYNCVCTCQTKAVIRGQNLFNGSSTKCSSCSNQVSKGQLEIFEFVKSLGFDVETENKSTGRRIDIFVPSKKFAIEYDGLIFHSDFFDKERVTEANEKSRYQHFKKHGISCMRIFEDSWKQKPELIKSMIANRLGVDHKLPALDYEIKLIENTTEFRVFFEENHLDGYANASFAFGAFVDGKLASVCSFRTYKFGKYAGQLELARFCSSRQFNSYGMFGQIMKAAKKHAKSLGFKQILSASDNCISSGNVYANNGFIFEPGSDSRLNYFYFLRSKGKRLHRAACQRLNPPEITQEQFDAFPTEAAQCESGLMALVRFGINQPLYKIYGWGNKLWILTL